MEGVETHGTRIKLRCRERKKEEGGRARRRGEIRREGEDADRLTSKSDIGIKKREKKKKDTLLTSESITHIKKKKNKKRKGLVGY